MDGTAELRQMAQLLRIGAGAARQVATLRPPADARRIETLARRAEEMAAEVEALTGDPAEGQDGEDSERDGRGLDPTIRDLQPATDPSLHRRH